MATSTSADDRISALEARLSSLERTVGSGLLGTAVLMDMLATAMDPSVDSSVREKALVDAQKTLHAMRVGFGGSVG